MTDSTDHTQSKPTEQLPLPGVATPPVEAQATAAPAEDAGYVTRTQMEQLLAQQQQMFQGLVERLAPAPQPTVPDPMPVFDANTIAEAYNTGDARKMAAAVERAMQIAEEKAYRRSQNELVELQNAVGRRAEGLTNTMVGIVTKSLPHMDDPVVSKAFHEKVAGLNAEMRSQPEVLRVIHQAVLGENVERLTQAAVEKALRKAAGSETQVPGSLTNTQAAPPEWTPPKSLVDACAAVGQTPDSFAQSLGYDSAKDYVESTETPAARARRKARETSATQH